MAASELGHLYLLGPVVADQRKTQPVIKGCVAALRKRSLSDIPKIYADMSRVGETDLTACFLLFVSNQSSKGT